MTSDWKPSASIHLVKLRAEVLSRIRNFFHARGVVEVETPLLGNATVTDPYIESLRSGPYYLQTSPEFAMKRLLSAGSGAIYQICKAFRANERGGRHNPEFTMLEWYRPDYGLHGLMEEVDVLLQEVSGTEAAEMRTYESVFLDCLNLNPHSANGSDLKEKAVELGCLPVGFSGLNREDWLNLLMAECVEPELGKNRPTFIYDYPVELCALARVRDGVAPVAERFEVYFRGTELANGYHELSDAEEQRERFAVDSRRRRDLGYEVVSHDSRLLSALEAGLPDCSGVALGIDRLLMIMSDMNSIDEVISFPIDRA